MRSAEPHELVEIAKLIRGHFPYLTMSVQDLKKVWDNGGEILVTYELESYLILDTKTSDGVIAQHRNCYYINYIGTRKSHRCKGLAYDLISTAKHVAIDNERPIYTYVASFNKKALNLFASQGFKVEREVVKYQQSWLELKWSPDASS